MRRVQPGQAEEVQLVMGNNKIEQASRYRIVVAAVPEAEQLEYVARAPEIPGCEARGATRGEAVALLEPEILATLENMEAQGIEPPMPFDLRVYDGQLATRVSPDLHRELAFAAQAANLELPALLAELLSRSARDPHGPSRGGGPRRERDGSGRHRRSAMDDQRYHGIMENRASFIEYVRQLERDGGQHSGGPPRGTRSRGGNRDRR